MPAPAVVVAAAALSESLIVGSVAVILLAVAWVCVAATLETHYLDLFREALSETELTEALSERGIDVSQYRGKAAKVNKALMM